MPPDVAVIFFICGRGGRELPRNVASKESLMGDREARRSSGNQYGDFCWAYRSWRNVKQGAIQQGDVSEGSTEFHCAALNVTFDLKKKQQNLNKLAIGKILKRSCLIPLIELGKPPTEGTKALVYAVSGLFLRFVFRFIFCIQLAVNEGLISEQSIIVRRESDRLRYALSCCGIISGIKISK